jgi:NAD(P)-dependent dehydrogenase (short-subunit alcohol dehydrogenase family)
MEGGMDIEGCTALVTGANRGLGRSYVDALFAQGATKVYAGARDPATITDPRATPLRLDVTSAEQVAAAAAACPDVTLVINNAGTMLAKPILDPQAEAALHAELNVNAFGVLRMAHAFAPVLAANAGGAIVNMLSVVSWYVYPFNATYCASKYAALAITNALRIQLKAQGTHVMGVYAGFIDTDMTAHVNGAKTSPKQVAERTLEGLRMNLHHVHADEAAAQLWEALKSDPTEVEVRAQQLWDEGRAWSI